jgi:hypothetical protein
MVWTSATGGSIVLAHSAASLPDREQLDRQSLDFLAAVQRAFQNSIASVVRLEAPYTLNISPSTSWLASVERRIENSTIPNEYKARTSSTEWLSEEVGQAAIRFFQNAADLLPGEPFIYGSRGGALVAEFEADNGVLTTVISPDATILFAVKTDEPDAPVEKTLRRGSNRLREEVKEIARLLSDSHGHMGPTR